MTQSHSTPPQSPPPADDNETDFLELARMIWSKPEATIRIIVDHDPRYCQREIILIISVASGLLAIKDGLGMMMLEIILNFILTVLMLHMTAVTIYWTGKPMGGKATYQELCAAINWSMIPAIVGILFAFGLSLTAGPDNPVPDLFEGLFYLYSFHLMFATVSEVQRFSYWKSTLNQVLAFIPILLPFFLFWNQILNALKPLMGAVSGF